MPYSHSSACLPTDDFGWATTCCLKPWDSHPARTGFAYRRVKNNERDAADLADLLRMGRLPEAWIASRQMRELRELTRYRHLFRCPIRHNTRYTARSHTYSIRSTCRRVCRS
jgi:hypothetical protein